MTGQFSPEDLKAALPTGLLSFPVTDFDAAGEFNERSYRARLEWLSPYGTAALFAAGGTGEFFSLTQREYSAVIRSAIEGSGGQVPIVAGAGYGTRMAIEYAREAERLGAAGILLMPPYLTETSQAGLRTHIAAVCKSTRLGVIVYNRANCRVSAETLQAVADECPNLIGFKDGVGEIEAMVSVYNALGERLTYLGGLPTAEVYAQAYLAMGVPTYSSAVFNFIPRTALEFYKAVTTRDDVTVTRLLRDFFFPYLKIRNRQPGYAVSIVKAGASIVGRGAGPVRSPLSDLTEAEMAQLRPLIEALGPQ
ncbi:5-dehydro-4-deoxyglucarate dehydratase [Roseomonas marmotae]|uniref:Probable 5-dehydro-4-deoxyglucarate dehydratase n=1 Tax=Roseomonas marmotae TaxID=2768161 RepID=A0ABS3K6N5_9PROT|nr:5-dehydro-4-deoxyglucarate dehydratase [Roseomonas marmotae]MBO1073111.1 5-dehydro-4-deoxyglucarate dehydratase [Roseomonas marmotae]QTI79251.1 5-dehydro-4-deoxyglucarate dehydratase [Roseomonas marmotae]